MSTLPKSDTELWNAVRRDDRAAFNELFERYWVRLYKTAHYYLSDAEACQEIVNDIFVSIWTRRSTLQISAFLAFMQTAVRFQIIKHQKSKKLHIVFQDELTAEPMHTNDGELRIREKEINAVLSRHLDKLPKRCQEIFELSRFDQLSNQEIADKLQISKRSVENQLALAVKHLKSCLKYGSLGLFLLELLLQ